MSTKFMMATKATHKLGDISRPQPSLCVVSDEDGDNYVGNWVTGFGFVDVKFPKDTTRDLTPEEIEEYHGTPVAIGSGAWSFINTKGEKLGRNVRIVKKQNGEVTYGKLMSPLKVGGVMYIIRDASHYFKSSNILEVNGLEVKTRNSTYTIEYVGDEAPVA